MPAWYAHPARSRLLALKPGETSQKEYGEGHYPMNADYKTAGLQAYDLEKIMRNDTRSAIEIAIEAAVATASRAWTKATRDDILEKAEDMDVSDGGTTMDDLSTDGPASLIWYASLLDETLPYEDQLENDDQGR